MSKRSKFSRIAVALLLAFFAIMVLFLFSVFCVYFMRKKRNIPTPRFVGKGIEYYEGKTNCSKKDVSSSFERTEYDCKGSCYCEEERRNSGTMIFRGVSCLVASISTVLAIEVAKNNFKAECKDIFSSTCSLSEITSSVDSCEEVNIKKVDPEEVEKEKIEEDIRRYHCSGKCLTKHLTYEATIKLAEEFNCDRLWREGEVSKDCTGKNPITCRNAAVKKWQRMYLTEFCKLNSRVEHLYDSFGEGIERTFIKNISLCVASKTRTKGNNRTIKCKQISKTKYKRKTV